jgi:hypothetical protein
MTKIYKIESIGDFLKIPSDRIHVCLQEMADHMAEFKAGLEALGIEPTGDEIKTFTWEDDGKNDLNITLNCVDGRSATVKIIRGEPAND